MLDAKRQQFMCGWDHLSSSSVRVAPAGIVRSIKFWINIDKESRKSYIFGLILSQAIGIDPADRAHCDQVTTLPDNAVKSYPDLSQ